MNEINESHEGETSYSPKVMKVRSLVNPAAWITPVAIGILLIVVGLVNETPMGYLSSQAQPEYGVCFLGLTFLGLGARIYFGYLLEEVGKHLSTAFLALMFIFTGITAVLSATGIGAFFSLLI